MAWALAHESAFPGPAQYTPCPNVYVTGSGLVRSPRGLRVVLAAERDLTMESYLGTLGAWLVLPPRLRRNRLLNMTPSTGLTPTVGGGGTSGIVGALSRAPSWRDVRRGQGSTGRGGCVLPVGVSSPDRLPLPTSSICHLCCPCPLALPRRCCLHSGAGG